MTIHVFKEETSVFVGRLGDGWEDDKGYHLGFNCGHDAAFVDAEGDITCPDCPEGQGMSGEDIDRILSANKEDERFIPYGE